MGSPRAARSATRWRPMKPVPPVMKYPMFAVREPECRDVTRVERVSYRGKPRVKTDRDSLQYRDGSPRTHVGSRSRLAPDGPRLESDDRHRSSGIGVPVGTGTASRSGSRALLPLLPLPLCPGEGCAGRKLGRVAPVRRG